MKLGDLWLKKKVKRKFRPYKMAHIRYDKERLRMQDVRGEKRAKHSFLLHMHVCVCLYFQLFISSWLSMKHVRKKVGGSLYQGERDRDRETERERDR